MSRRNVLLLILLVVVGWQAIRHWELRAVHPPDGILAPDDPQQTDPEHQELIAVGHWTLTPRAAYDVTARVLGREEYSLDSLAEIVPEDLALGWGPMSDNTVLNQLEMEQSVRAYRWRPLHGLPIPGEQVTEHSANTHVIAANPSVAREIARLRVGQVVHLQGLLVDARRDDGLYIRTSLTRRDRGEGACEVLYVESVDVE